MLDTEEDFPYPPEWPPSKGLETHPSVSMTFYLHFELATAFSFHYYSNCNSDGKTIDLRLRSEYAKDYEEKENN